MRFAPKLIAVAGGPGSGKDELIRAVKDLGVLHAEMLPKHTSRERRGDDGTEMICPGDDGWDLQGCDIRYENYGDMYGIKSSAIWNGLAKGVFQVLVVSEVGALNKLRKTLGELVKLVYVHSELGVEEYLRGDVQGGDTVYARKRAERYWSALEMYVENIAEFDHVLIHAGPVEDLYDQIFRLFRAYERGELV